MSMSMWRLRVHGGGRLSKHPLRKQRTEWVEDCYVAHGCSIGKAAKAIGVHHGTLKAEMERRGIRRRKPDGLRRALESISTQEMLRLYRQHHETSGPVAQMLGVTTGTFRREMNRRGLRCRMGHRSATWRESTLREMYETKRMSIDEIATHYGVSYSTVRLQMVALGIARRPAGCLVLARGARGWLLSKNGARAHHPVASADSWKRTQKAPSDAGTASQDLPCKHR